MSSDSHLAVIRSGTETFAQIIILTWRQVSSQKEVEVIFIFVHVRKEIYDFSSMICIFPSKHI